MSKKIRNRRLLLGLGTTMIISTPIFLVVACKVEEINSLSFEPSSEEGKIKAVIMGKKLPIKSNDWSVKYELINNSSTTNTKSNARYWLNI